MTLPSYMMVVPCVVVVSVVVFTVAYLIDRIKHRQPLKL